MALIRVLLIFLVIQYGTYIEEKFDELKAENSLLRSVLIESLRMEYFSLRIKERTDIEEFRFIEIGKQLENLNKR